LYLMCSGLWYRQHPRQQPAIAPLSSPTMFKKDLVAGAKSKVKSSVQRGIRAKVLETYPNLEPHIDEIMPKKSQLDLVKL